MSILEIKDLHFNQGKWELFVPALSLVKGEILGVIGKNGAGKSTLLRLMSMAIKPRQGEVWIDGRKVGRNDLAIRRRITVVMGEPLLVRGSVQENVGLALRLRGIKGQQYRREVDFWLRYFDLGYCAQQVAKTLSDGEAQKVSLARAFAARPEIIFLDEPFSSLDVPTRDKLLVELRRALRDHDTTTVLITHRWEELPLLCDRVLVLVAGRVVQLDRAESVVARPDTKDVAELVGFENIWTRQEGDRMVHTCLRADDARIMPPGRGRRDGIITEISPAGSGYRVVVDDGFNTIVMMSRQEWVSLCLREGMKVGVDFAGAAVWEISAGVGNKA